MENRNIPTYEFVVDDTSETGVKTVSIVSDPAFGTSAVFFNKQRPKFVVLEENKMKQIVTGFSILADYPVYRIDNATGMEYMGYFSPKTIEKIVEKYHEEMLSNKVNLDHNSDAYIDAFMTENFIVKSEHQIAYLKSIGLEHPNAMNSWVTSFKIKDPEVFKAIVENQNSGNITGFSIEAYLDVLFTKTIKNNNNNNKVNKMNKKNKSILDKIIALFTEIQMERALVPELAFEIEWNAVGEPVNKVVVDQDGNETFEPVGVGEFVTEYGIIVVDENSNLVEIRELPEEPEVEIEQPEIEIPVSGVTGTTGTTDTTMADYPWDTCISDQLAAGYSQSAAEKICGYIKSKNMTKEELTDDILASILDQSELLPQAPVVKKGIDKTILEIVGSNDGYYMLDVIVQDGVIVSATVVTQQDLLMKSQEFKDLQTKVVELEAKLKEPIGDPILEPVKEPLDFSKMTAYQKLMYNKGLQAV